MKRLLTIVAVLLLPVIGVAAARQGRPDSTPPGVTHYTRVDATVACGGATAPEAYPALREEGFAAVVNLRTPEERGADIAGAKAAVEAAGMKFVHIPFNAQSPDVAAVERFLSAVRDPANSPVYIHCGSASRVGAMWLIKRVVVDGWDVEKATTEAERIGLRSPQLKQFALDYVRRHKG